MKRNDPRLLRLIQNIQEGDKSLGKELKGLRKKTAYVGEARNLAASIAPSETETEAMDSIDTNDALESIVLRVGRPVLTIFKNEAKLVFQDSESQVWKEKLGRAKNKLDKAIRSVGRIELRNHPYMDWVGTGWLVAPGIVVTNRHVAEVFGVLGGNGFVFRQGSDGQSIGSKIDLLEEAGRLDDFSFTVSRIMHIEPEPGPDIAFLELGEDQGGKKEPEKISLMKDLPKAPFDVAVIGYPAKDSRVPDQALMERLFGALYDKKRLAPGQVTAANLTRISHDCSTLGGSSGSVVMDLRSGNAVGLHFAGRFLESNFAVPAALVAERLKQVQSRSGRVSTVVNRNRETTLPVRVADLVSGARIDVPLSITLTPTPSVSLGEQSVVRLSDDGFNEIETEAKAADYEDREGFKESFIGAGMKVPLPKITDQKRKKDILFYQNRGKKDFVLRYEHFSVVMSKSRRLCFFSAANINGAKSKKQARVAWRMDPRIPDEAQILKECYGNPPKFSRGHMTRREDPVWGTSMESMKGNADSMCVTNTVPQMQSFNAPIWLALEDHALNNARADKMNLCVFTGPIMKSNDPVRYGVKIPVTFWKVIAFVHDETGKLCATGYKMSQTEQMPEEEFVFGKFKNAQVSISWIEDQTGLSFGKLTSLDPMKSDNEAVAGTTAELSSLQQVRFV